MTTNLGNTNDALATADIAIPRFSFNDDNRRQYLSWRLCGYSRTEAAKQIGVTLRTITGWGQKDTEFNDIDRRDLLDLRKNLAKEVVALDFTRNLKMCLELDRKVLKKAVDNDPLQPMTKDDIEYLNKIRPLYTPQQLKILEDFFTDKQSDMSWDEIIVLARRHYGTTQEKADENSNQVQLLSSQYPQGAVIEGRVTGREETS